MDATLNGYSTPVHGQTYAGIEALYQHEALRLERTLDRGLTVAECFQVQDWASGEYRRLAEIAGNIDLWYAAVLECRDFATLNNERRVNADIEIQLRNLEQLIRAHHAAATEAATEAAAATFAGAAWLTGADAAEFGPKHA